MINDKVDCDITNVLLIVHLGLGPPPISDRLSSRLSFVCLLSPPLKPSLSLTLSLSRLQRVLFSIEYRSIEPGSVFSSFLDKSRRLRYFSLSLARRPLPRASTATNHAH